MFGESNRSGIQHGAGGELVARYLMDAACVDRDELPVSAGNFGQPSKVDGSRVLNFGADGSSLL